MREIKFRAWDGNRMIDPVWVWNPAQNHFEHYNEFHENWMYGLRTENVILMQFTDLKDKTGKEIYEGDVIEHTQSVRTGTSVHYDRHKRGGPTTYSINKEMTGRGMVEWNGHSYIVKSNLYDDYDSYFMVCDRKDKPSHRHDQIIVDSKVFNKYIIIGNIYENPGLLQ